MKKRFIFNVNEDSVEIKEMHASEVIDNLVKKVPLMIEQVLTIMTEDIDSGEALKSIAIMEIIKRLTQGGGTYDVINKEVKMK